MRVIILALVTLSTIQASAAVRKLTCIGKYEDYGYSEKVTAGADIDGEVATVWFKSNDLNMRIEKLDLLANSKIASIEGSDRNSTIKLEFEAKGLSNPKLKRFYGSVSNTSFFSGESVSLACSLK